MANVLNVSEESVNKVRDFLKKHATEANTREIKINLQTMSFLAGVSVGTLRKATNELERRGIIKKIRTRPYSCSFTYLYEGELEIKNELTELQDKYKDLLVKYIEINKINKYLTKIIDQLHKIEANVLSIQEKDMNFVISLKKNKDTEKFILKRGME